MAREAPNVSRLRPARIGLVTTLVSALGMLRSFQGHGVRRDSCPPSPAD
jgi:hypothetical protein